MQVKAQLKSYEALEFSITLTASVKDWRAISKQLDKLKENDAWVAWPMNAFVACIDKMLSDLDKTHWDVAYRTPETPTA